MNASQYSIDFSALAKEGEILARQGLMRAVDKADRDNDGWSDRCFSLFLEWLKEKPVGFTFLIETFRLHLERNGKIEKPKSKRAYGFLSLKAKKQGLIKWFDNGRVSNKDAHDAIANVWQKL